MSLLYWNRFFPVFAMHIFDHFYGSLESLVFLQHSKYISSTEDGRRPKIRTINFRPTSYMWQYFKYLSISCAAISVVALGSLICVCRFWDALYVTFEQVFNQTDAKPVSWLVGGQMYTLEQTLKLKHINNVDLLEQNLHVNLW